MPIEMFLKLTGIDGESVDAKHKGEIDVLAWSWGLSSEPASGTGGGTGSGRVKIENISIQKLVDLASPLLLLSSAQGKHVQTGTLTTRGKGGGEFLLFKMSDVVVTSVHIVASKDDSVPAENVTLNFSKLEFDYKATKPDGSLGTQKVFKWDVRANKPF